MEIAAKLSLIFCKDETLFYNGVDIFKQWKSWRDNIEEDNQKDAFFEEVISRRIQ